MHEIKLVTIDALNKIVSDLDDTKISAEHYLFQKQIETVKKLTDTVFSEDFVFEKNERL